MGLISCMEISLGGKTLHYTTKQNHAGLPADRD